MIRIFQFNLNPKPGAAVPPPAFSAFRAPPGRARGKSEGLRGCICLTSSDGQPGRHWRGGPRSGLPARCGSQEGGERVLQAGGRRPGAGKRAGKEEPGGRRSHLRAPVFFLLRSGTPGAPCPGEPGPGRRRSPGQEDEVRRGIPAARLLNWQPAPDAPFLWPLCRTGLPDSGRRPPVAGLAFLPGPPLFWIGTGKMQEKNDRKRSLPPPDGSPCFPSCNFPAGRL